MTGLGERSHLLSKDINLDTHITDIVNVFKWEDLRNVCLVVHSYGGWPGSGAIEQAFDRISSIVWLDAFLPEDGQRGFDFANPQSRAGTLAAMREGRGRTAGAEGANSSRSTRRIAPGSIRSPLRSRSASRCSRSSFTGAREKVGKKLYIRAPIFPQSGVRRRLCRVQGRSVVENAG